LHSVKGMTLCELMIAVAIIAVLSSVAVPSFFSMLTSYRFAKAAVDLEGFLQRVKLKSIKHKTSYTVYFDQERNGYYEIESGSGERMEGPFVPFDIYRAGIVIEKSKNIIFTRNGLIRGTGKIVLKASSGVLKRFSFCMAGGISLDTKYR